MSENSTHAHQPHPENLHPEQLEDQTPFYRRPIFIAPIALGVLFIGSMWAYALNMNEWLEDSEGSNQTIDEILAANPELSREDLEADAQAGDLSFWLRGTGQTPLDAGGVDAGDEDQPPSLLEQYMEQQESKEAEESNQNNNSSEPNPLLNLPNPMLLDNIANNNSSQEGDQPRNASRSTLDMFLNPGSATPTPNNTSGNPLADALNRLSVGTSTAENPNNPDNNGEEMAEETSGENNTGVNPNGMNNNEFNPNGMGYQQPNVPMNSANSTYPNSSYSGSSGRGRSSGYSSSTSNSRRGYIGPANPAMSNPTTTVNPRLGAPTTNPYGNNGLNNGLSQSNPYGRQQTTRGTQRNSQGSTLPQNSPQTFPRMGGGQINTFSDPFGTSQGR